MPPKPTFVNLKSSIRESYLKNSGLMHFKNASLCASPTNFNNYSYPVLPKHLPQYQPYYSKSPKNNDNIPKPKDEKPSVDQVPIPKGLIQSMANLSSVKDSYNNVKNVFFVKNLIGKKPMIVLMKFINEQEKLKGECSKLTERSKNKSLDTISKQNDLMMKLVSNLEESREQKLQEKIRKLKAQVKQMEYSKQQPTYQQSEPSINPLQSEPETIINLPEEPLKNPLPPVKKPDRYPIIIEPLKISNTPEPVMAKKYTAKIRKPITKLTTMKHLETAHSQSTMKQKSKFINS